MLRISKYFLSFFFFFQFLLCENLAVKLNNKTHRKLSSPYKSALCQRVICWALSGMHCILQEFSWLSQVDIFITAGQFPSFETDETEQLCRGIESENICWFFCFLGVFLQKTFVHSLSVQNGAFLWNSCWCSILKHLKENLLHLALEWQEHCHKVAKLVNVFCLSFSLPIILGLVNFSIIFTIYWNNTYCSQLAVSPSWFGTLHTGEEILNSFKSLTSLILIFIRYMIQATILLQWNVDVVETCAVLNSSLVDGTFFTEHWTQ